jgi:hypothetical protein
MTMCNTIHRFEKVVRSWATLGRKFWLRHYPQYHLSIGENGISPAGRILELYINFSVAYYVTRNN